MGLLWYIPDHKNNNNNNNNKYYYSYYSLLLWVMQGFNHLP